MSNRRTESRVSTGVPELDAILRGGLVKNRLYLVQGDPGTGKTTFALQFLLEGARRGERGLYVTLAETRDELLDVMASHGWPADGIEIFEVKASEDDLKPEEHYTAFHPSEVELGEAVQTLLAEVERVKPARVVIDSLSEMRLLARDPLRYRRQLVALKQFIVSRGATVLFLDNPITRSGEHQFNTLAHGVIQLERSTPAYGRERRQLQVVKLRGVAFHGGYHDFAIRTGGFVVYPCLVAAEHRRTGAAEKVPSELPELDALLSGGPERGTSTLVVGPAGVGKSTLCLQYALAAARRGEHAALYSFDERPETMFRRAAALGMDLQTQVDAGRVTVDQVDPAELSPGEFLQKVRHGVERDKARVVVIDSLDGYLNAMPGEQFLVLQMHELLTYLGQQGVLTFVVVAQHGILGAAIPTPVDLSYLADTVFLLRYFEHAGRVRKALSVVKNRSGPHENTIRELSVSPDGVRVGGPLTEFHGVLSGTPHYTGGGSPLLGEGGAPRGQ